MIHNLNDIVLVRLTQAGKRMLAMACKDQPSWAPKPEADGRYEFQLWELMQTFGPHITMGGDIPFEQNEIEVKKL